MQTFVKARVTVPGVHRWPDAPDQFAPLRSWHRHLFTVEAEVGTDHGNRAVEFIDLGRRVRDVLVAEYEPCAWWGPWTLDFRDCSCEDIAAGVLRAMPGLRRVTVWEDGENAGGAEHEP